MNALSNMGLLSRFVGMLTDSRSFLSYSRHDYFRRLLCNLLGNDVERGPPARRPRAARPAGRGRLLQERARATSASSSSRSAPQARCATIVFFRWPQTRAVRASGQPAENCRQWRETAARSDGNCAPRPTGVLIPTLHAPRAREETRMNRTHMFLAATIGALAAGCRDLPADDAIAGGNGSGEETARRNSSSPSRPPARSASASSPRRRPERPSARPSRSPRRRDVGIFDGVLPTARLRFGDAFTAACSAIGSATSAGPPIRPAPPSAPAWSRTSCLCFGRAIRLESASTSCATSPP